jgi:hypothetical protein
MISSRRRVSALVAATLGASALAASAASADTVPSFARCPTGVANVVGCVVVQSTDGTLQANGHSLPIDHSLKVEGGITANPDTGELGFVGPVSGSAITAAPITVPGGLFGMPLPGNLNTVKATVEQVGAVGFDYGTYDLTLPIRVKFANPLLGSNCAIGSAQTPITLHLTTGTTSPALPNQPISGSQGAVSVPDGTLFETAGNVEVDNAFSVPAATNCGLIGSKLVTKAINAKLGLPSVAGRNFASVTDDLFVGAVS